MAAPKLQLSSSILIFSLFLISLSTFSSACNCGGASPPPAHPKSPPPVKHSPPPVPKSPPPVKHSPPPVPKSPPPVKHSPPPVPKSPPPVPKSPPPSSPPPTPKSSPPSSPPPKIPKSPPPSSPPPTSPPPTSTPPPSPCPPPLSPPKPSVPPPSPPKAASPPPPACPINTLKLGACANLLGISGIIVGSPASSPCCTLLTGLADLEAALCLCTAIKANVLGINLDVPITLSVILNDCGKSVPSGFKCA